MPGNLPPFVITASRFGVVVKEKRGGAESAMVLADRWDEDGYHNIQITDADGVVRDRDAFRENLSLVKRLKLRLRKPSGL